MEPPKMQFLTPIYHPNIDSAGRICLDSLKMPPKGAWKPSLNISTLLTSVLLLMTEPNPDDPLMTDIVSIRTRANRNIVTNLSCTSVNFLKIHVFVRSTMEKASCFCQLVSAIEFVYYCFRLTNSRTAEMCSNKRPKTGLAYTRRTPPTQQLPVVTWNETMTQQALLAITSQVTRVLVAAVTQTVTASQTLETLVYMTYMAYVSSRSSRRRRRANVITWVVNQAAHRRRRCSRAITRNSNVSRYYILRTCSSYYPLHLLV